MKDSYSGSARGKLKFRLEIDRTGRVISGEQLNGGRIFEDCVFEDSAVVNKGVTVIAHPVYKFDGEELATNFRRLND